MSRPKPRNPRHLDTIKGGRKECRNHCFRYVYTRILLSILFGVQTVSADTFRPAFDDLGYGARQMLNVQNDHPPATHAMLTVSKAGGIAHLYLSDSTGKEISASATYSSAIIVSEYCLCPSSV